MNWVDDLGAPLAVTAIDLVVESTAPEYNEWAAYGTAGLAWLASSMGWARGQFVKNVAIASTPWAAKQIYQRVRGGTPVTSKLRTRSVSRWPAPLVEQPFGGARLV